MKFFLKIVIILLSSVLISCNGSVKNFNTILDEEADDSIITVNELPNKEVLLTSHLDTDALLLYIPYEIEIKQQKNEIISGITSHIYANAEGGTPSQIPIFNIKTFELLQPDYFEENPNLNKVIEYRLLKFYPKRDTIAKSLMKELEFIKANCKENNKYFNDTIRYKSIKEFEAEHQNIYKKTYEHKELKVNLLIKKDTTYREFTKIYTFKY